MKCDTCNEPCPMADMAHEAAKGRMYATKELIALQKKIEGGQLVEVVRCQDCKRSGLTEFGKRYCSEPMGAFVGCIPVEDDSFCSGGKRREDAHAQD